ncbi:hypothetical protein BDZ89DRAFT_1076292 [Hymenopellis radicata]|nr:hypothetical protein BDZ89DRAFT_1076292 [Hymenopellis radicata]
MAEREVYTRLVTLAERMAVLDLKPLSTAPDLTQITLLLSHPKEGLPPPPPRLFAAAVAYGIARWFARQFEQSSTLLADQLAAMLLCDSGYFYMQLGQRHEDDDFERQYPERLLATLDWLHEGRLCPVVTYLQLLVRATRIEDWTHDEALRFARDWAVQEVGEQTAFVVMAVTMGKHVARTQKELAEVSGRTHTNSHAHGILHTLTHWAYSLSSYASRGYVHIPESRSDSFALDDSVNVHLVQDSAKKLGKLGVLYSELLRQDDDHPCVMAPAPPEANHQHIADVDIVVKKRNEVAVAICFWKNFIMGKMDMITFAETGLQAVPNVTQIIAPHIEQTPSVPLDGFQT